MQVWGKHCGIPGRHTSIHGQGRKPTAISGCSRLVTLEQVIFLAIQKTAAPPEKLHCHSEPHTPRPRYKIMGKYKENPNASNREHDYVCQGLWVKSQLGSGEGDLQMENAPILSCWHAEGQVWQTAQTASSQGFRTHHP